MKVKSGAKIIRVDYSGEEAKIYGSLNGEEDCVAQLYFSDPSQYQDEDDDDIEDPCWVGQVNLNKYLTADDNILFKVFTAQTREEAKILMLRRLKDLGFENVSYI